MWDSYDIAGGASFNWLSGTYDTVAGMAYHGGWMYQGTDAWPTNTWNYDYVKRDWMLVTDQWELFRMNKYRHYNAGQGTWTAGYILGISLGVGRSTAQYTSWDCATVLLYGRELDQTEIRTVSGPGMATQSNGHGCRFSLHDLAAPSTICWAAGLQSQLAKSGPSAPARASECLGAG
jgi:hypothetical protein